LKFYRQGSHASWKVLDFFLQNSTTWKVLENHFGPGKSWKLKLNVLESPEKISLKKDPKEKVLENVLWVF